MLELPRERHSRSNSETSAFTRNPKDRYLTPVPPAPLRSQPSSRTGSGISSSYSLAPPSPWAPKSATYPPADQYLSPNVIRHARSASASPYMPSTPIFPDFKTLKEKLASKRSASRIRSSSKPKELEIGSPVLVSSTVDKDSLVPLAVYQPSISRDGTPAALSKVTRSMPSIRRQFKPLASNPVDPILDGNSGVSELPANEEVPLRRRSHVPTTVATGEFKFSEGRIRANSADTERSERLIFSNDPWLSSPKPTLGPVTPDRLVEDGTTVAPTLQRYASHLGLPEVCARPTSSHEAECSVSLRESPLNKDLPDLPLYVAPSPLFACIDSLAEKMTAAELPGDEPNQDMDFNEDIIDFYCSEPRSHFSTWSSANLACSPSISDDEAIRSPTFSSFTSSCGNSPECHAVRYSYTSTSPQYDSKRATIVYECSGGSDEEVQTKEADYDHRAYLSSTPPQLESLRISRFGAGLLDLARRPNDMASRRQATCFGLGFHYSLPEDETTSKTTITQNRMQSEPVVAGQRQSAINQLNTLLDEFAFLGDAVI